MWVKYLENDIIKVNRITLNRNDFQIETDKLIIAVFKTEKEAVEEFDAIERALIRGDNLYIITPVKNWKE